MHELSIAMGIVKIAENETHKANAKSVTLIELEIGTLSGIEISSLEFVWPMAVQDSVLEKAERKIDIVPAQAICNDCATAFDLENHYDSCPQCGSYFKNIMKGREMRVIALEVV
jgi:hydrogenase nickel incorporation protein HypA/HybF